MTFSVHNHDDGFSFLLKNIHKDKLNLSKDGLISDGFSLWLKSPKKVPNPECAQDRDLAPFFLSKSEKKNLEIKPLLVNLQIIQPKNHKF